MSRRPSTARVALVAGLLAVAAGTFVGISLLLPPELEVPPQREVEERPPPPRPVHWVEEEPVEPVELVEELPELPPEEEAMEEWPEDALENELIVAFRSSRELERFYQKIREGDIEVVGVMNDLNAVRVRFGPGEEERVREAAREGEVAYNYVTGVPDLPEVDDAGPAPQRGFASDAEIEGSWGNGVRIAVLDTGVAAHPALAEANVREINLLGESGAYDVGHHGTAVASIIAGSGDVPGIAPGSEILSVRVLDGDGMGNSFLLAQGIVEAVNQGADLVAISLGSAGSNFLMEQAVDYAVERGSVLIAAAGNDGEPNLMHPARHPDVVGVTAVDQQGRLAPFSNFGEGVTMAAPGVGLPAAYRDEGVFFFSGTSGAVPYVTGDIAAIMSEHPELSAYEAAAVARDFSDDRGPAGPDLYHGQGVTNRHRALRHRQTNIVDMAVADHFLMQAASGEVVVQVSVQNRGTTAVNNVRLWVTIDGRRRGFELGSLPSGEVKAELLAVPASGRVVVYSQVDTGSAVDEDLSNNEMVSRFNMDLVRERVVE